LPVIQNAVLAACDSQDGLKDGLLSDPRTCRFDPAVLLCKTRTAKLPPPSRRSIL
jgi:feruloyl esterase